MIDMGYVFLTVVYMLVGFQVGGRCFFWDISIDRSPTVFWVNLVIVPLLWPVVLMLSLIPGGVREALYRWDE